MQDPLPSRSKNRTAFRGPGVGGLVAAMMLFAGPAFAGLGFGEPRPLNTNSFTDSRNDFSCELATDGHGVWLAVWHGAEPLGDTGGDTDLIYARSTDNGDTWSSPAKFNSNALVDSGIDGAAHHEVSPSGTWIVGWQSTDTLEGQIETDSDILFQRSTNRGLSWTQAAALNSNASIDTGSDFNPRFATNGQGTWISVWLTEEDLDADGVEDFELAWARSTDDGITWSDISLVNPTAGQHVVTDLATQDIATDGAGNWVAVWSSNSENGGPNGTDYDIYRARSTDEGATWSETAPLNPYAAEDVEDDGHFGIGLQRVDVQVDASPDGTFVAVWASRHDLGGIGTDTDILASRSSDGGLTWSDAFVVNSNAATDIDGSAGADVNARIIRGTDGAWLATWETLAYSPPNYSEFDIAASRSTDDGRTWSPISPLNFFCATDFSGADNAPWIASGANGRYLCAWFTNQPFFGGTDYDIVVSVSDDIREPPDPPLDVQHNVRVIVEYLLGTIVLDANGDGVVDSADAMALFVQD